MARSRPPGSSSSLRAAKGRGPADLLRGVVNSIECSTITAALGADADVYLVGGTVRDALLGLPAADLDLASRLRPEEALARLTRAGVRTIETGLRHGTLTAVVNGKNIEITTFRRPGAAHGFAESIGEDLGGRDFTINAMAFSVSGRELVDPFDGEKDLGAGIVRAVGSASERFAEDPLRVLRLVRFSSAAGRTADKATFDAARDAAPRLASVSVERVRVELERMLLSPHPGAAFRDLLSIGAIALVLPEALPSVAFEQNEFHTHDVWEHTLWVLDRTPPDLVVRLAALFHDFGKPASLSVGDDGRRHFYKHEQISADLAKGAMSRLRFSNDQITAVSNIVALHMRPIECGPSGVRRLMRDLGPDFDRWKDIKCADLTPLVDEKEFAGRLRTFNEMVDTEMTRAKGSVYGKLAVDGNDLIALGMREGPALGALLKKLEELVIENPEMNEREALLQRAKDELRG